MIPALVRGLVEWLPTSATWTGIVAGPLVILGYLAGSIPVGYLLARARLRRQLERPVSDDRRRSLPDRAHLPVTAADEVVGAGLVLLAATIAWDVGLEAAPRGSFSAVATYANQAIGAWASIALWTGLAAVVGTVAPVWTRFRGGSGVVPGAALLAVYAPMLLAAAAAVAAVAYAVTRDGRRSVVAALPALVVAGYVAWVADWQSGNGVGNGPEVALWATVLAGVLAVRNARTPAPSPD